jgi:bisphosphoglycerate-independent phosphoglycerate mutase (AlkP superfamily)
MNNILIIIDEESDERDKIIDIHDKIINIHDNLTLQYYMIQRTQFTIIKPSESKILFQFTIDEKEQCKEFLKQCNEEGCNMDNIKIELRIQTNI